MEANVPACFRTNVLGTARLAQVAVDCGVDRFVMISSDKAVRPTSIMGATKRIAERVIAEMPAGKTTFVSVRFGNVLDSSGSVIPLFKRQIAQGGPVTVTTPEVRRFFMTIPEAVDLTLMAGTVGRHGEVMVLEMGEAIRIVDLARRLIELSGLLPDKDIRIEFVGLRPGEKEYEEVMTEDENVVRTAHEKIWVLKKNGERPTMGTTDRIDLARIESLVTAGDEAGLRSLAIEYVPENHLPK
jgi:FlaA1/EpsC-like NDP-sugar epimerase